MKLHVIQSIIKRHSTEVGCLLSEGYIEVSTVMGLGESCSTLLRHSRNTNRIMITTTAEEVAIIKNGLLIKRIPAPYPAAGQNSVTNQLT